ncbi:uncharacterized protein LOC143281590 [Babylonia areolata]|uniref:uncharacterized protein LOC143281590 n=1 Tax=Babylonia areolata TaxID=304850 RepID=UPI003FCFD5FD
MRAGQRAQGKPTPQGATGLPRRGGAHKQQRPDHHHQLQNHHQSHPHLLQRLLNHPPPQQQEEEAVVVVVKQETPEERSGGSGFVGGGGVRTEGEEGATTAAGEAGSWQTMMRNRQLLKKSIMDRRQARGLGPISCAEEEDACSRVQHELTPDEVKKREKRKEQNRRAAKKCRQKKKLLQMSAEEDFSAERETNERLEKEKARLQAEVATLQRLLEEHEQSGQCLHVNPAPMATSSHSPPRPLTSTPMPAYTPTACSPSSSIPATAEQLGVVSSEQYAYLKDFGAISPEHTFNDFELERLVELTHLGDLQDLNDIDCSTIPQPAGLHDESLKTGPAGSPGPYGTTTTTTCYWSDPTSPVVVTGPHDRHSVSSEASEWSVVSDQSQGFGQVPTTTQTPQASGGGRGCGSVMGLGVGSAGSYVPGRSVTSSSSAGGGGGGDYWEAELSSPLGVYQQELVGLSVVPVQYGDHDLEDDVFADRGCGGGGGL